jgi:uncharacterized protein DUF4291
VVPAQVSRQFRVDSAAHEVDHPEVAHGLGAMGVGLARKGIDCSQRLGRHRWTVARRPSAPVIRWRASNGAPTLVTVAEPKHQIRALHTASTVTVYQAYAPEIGLPAAQEGRFPATWQRDRMTCIIKPRS